MTQRQLNQFVSRLTGESIATIRRMGFSPLVKEAEEFDREPLVVDWDALDAQRREGYPQGVSPLVAAA